MTLVLAHRGATRAARENTLPAFAAAVALGADGVELDVRRSADGRLVVHHDAEAPDLGPIAEGTYAELVARRPGLPTLGEALDVCAGRLVNVELKIGPERDAEPTIERLVVDELAERGRRDLVVVSCFDLASLDRVLALDAEASTGLPTGLPTGPPTGPPTGLLTGLLTLPTVDALQGLAVVADHGHAALHPHVLALSGERLAPAMARAAELGVAVRAWTVNDLSEIARLAAAGVDAVVTDVPDAALQVLGRTP
jgi:glycerophosphoryl diester phosphodiesterase